MDKGAQPQTVTNKLRQLDKINDNDISIGQNKWISWIELDHSQTPLDIDELLEPTKHFWKLLETECFLECCGISAFDFSPENLKIAAQNYNDSSLKQKFEKLQLELTKKSDTQLISSFLNNLFDKRVFLQLTKHIITNL